MPKHRLPPSRSSQKKNWSEVLQVLALAPLTVGVLLLLTAVTGLLVWGSALEQIVAGVVYILLAFASSNAVQKQWALASGWLMVGGALWLELGLPVDAVRIAAGAFAAIGIAILAREFLRRRRQYLESPTRCGRR